MDYLALTEAMYLNMTEAQYLTLPETQPHPPVVYAASGMCVGSSVGLG